VYYARSRTHRALDHAKQPHRANERIERSRGGERAAVKGGEPMPRKPAKACPEGQRYCPDCAAEGLDGCRPVDEFYVKKAAGSKGGVRYTAYCKRHWNLRSTISKRKAAPDSPRRESQRRAAQAHYQRNKDAPAYKERQRANSAAYRKRNPEKAAAMHQAWVEGNREQHRRHNQAYRERQRARRAVVRKRRTDESDDCAE
jgi:hypothetical protein